MGFFPETQYDFPNVSAYDSDLRELIAMYRKVTSDYAAMVAGLHDLEEKYRTLSADLKALERLVDRYYREYAAFVQMTNAHLDRLDADAKTLYSSINSIHDLITEINARIDSVNHSLIEEIHKQTAHTDTAIASLRIELNAVIEEAINELEAKINDLEFNLPPVYNPAKDQQTEIPTLAMDYWYWLRYGGYFAEQFDASLKPTAEEYDAENRTATDWDANGAVILQHGWMSKEEQERLTNAINTAGDAVDGLTDLEERVNALPLIERTTPTPVSEVSTWGDINNVLWGIQIPEGATPTRAIITSDGADWMVALYQSSFTNNMQAKNDAYTAVGQTLQGSVAFMFERNNVYVGTTNLTVRTIDPIEHGALAIEIEYTRRAAAD